MTLDEDVKNLLIKNQIELNQYDKAYDYAMYKFKQEYPVRTGFHKRFVISQLYNHVYKYMGEKYSNDK